MENNEYAKKIEDLFTSYYEQQLSALLKNHPQLGEYTNCAFINTQHDLLIGYIKQHNKLFREDKISEKVQAEYDKALLQQMMYVLTEGDFHLMSGYDLTSNTMLSLSELEKRYIAPAATITLRNSGLLYRGLDRRRACDYPWGWY